MGIRQRGSTWLVDVSFKGVRRTNTCPTREAAEVCEVELRADLMRTVKASPVDTWTLRQAWEKTCIIAWADKKAGPQLRRNGEQVMEMLGPALPLTHITTDTVDTLVEQLQDQGWSNGTINRKLAALSRMLTIAEQRGKLQRMPHIQRKQESVCRIRFLTKEEEEKMVSLLTHWGKQEHADVVVILVDTGMRPSELWRIEGRDFDHQVVTIWESKNKTSRSVPMTARVADIFLRRAAQVGIGLLYPYNNWWLGNAWDKAKAHLKMDKDTQFIPYALRHTCLSRLVQRGVPLKVVQEWAGHKHITTTMRYAHLCPTSLLDVVKVLENA